MEAIRLFLRRRRCRCEMPTGLYVNHPHCCRCGLWWLVWGGRWLAVPTKVAEKLLLQQFHAEFDRELPRP